MKQVIEYLDDLKAKTGSDYATAKALEVTKEAVSKIRSRGQMSDETALRMADLLEIERGEVLLAAAMARSQGAVKSAWESVSKRAGIAASLALVVLIFGGSNEAEASKDLTRYTLCEVKGRRRRGFCVSAISLFLESILWHVRKALSIIPDGTVVV